MKKKKLKKKKVKTKGSCMGLDVSMSGTGVTIIDSNSGEHLLTTVIEPKLKLYHKILKEKFKRNVRNIDRVRVFLIYNFILAQLTILIDKYKVEYVVIEGYAYGKHSKAVSKLAELGSLVRMLLIDFDIPWIEITPQQLKQFVSGKGNTPKANMLREVFKKWGKEFEDIKAGLQLDAADSYGLGLMAYYIFTIGQGLLLELKKFDQEVIKKIVRESQQHTKDRKKKKKKDDE